MLQLAADAGPLPMPTAVTSATRSTLQAFRTHRFGRAMAAGFELFCAAHRALMGKPAFRAG